MRAFGWYWVKVEWDSDWEPYEFGSVWGGTAGGWQVPAGEGAEAMGDHYFYRIHEHRIEEPIEEEE